MAKLFKRSCVITLLFSALWLSGCINPPDYPEKPEIEFIRASQTVVNQLDTFSLTFRFQDGDGDLGFITDAQLACNLCDNSCLDDPDMNLFITNSRTGCLVNNYYIPFIPEEGLTAAISGEIKVHLFDCCQGCRPVPGHTDTVHYRIQIKDRAGHLSNAIQSPPIHLRCN